MLRRVFFALLASTTVFAAPEIDLGLTPEMLHGILREVAAKIEARHGSERPEAEKLVERIEAILATEPPPAREGGRAQAIAEGIHLINIDASAKSSLGGFRGYLFDGSLTGCLQTYHDLEKLDAKDADEVLRWIDMHRAAEAVCIIGMVRVMMDQKPEHIDMLPRTLQLDPSRHRTLGFLAAAAMTLKEKRDITDAAAMTLQLAALPGLPTRKLCAAGAAKIGDYETALRLLDDCAKEKPGDLMILQQHIATLLRQSQSKAAIKKATLLYGDITPDTVIDKTAALEKADRQTFLHTYLLHLLLKPDTQTASELLTKLVDEQVLDESSAEEVRKWMEK